MYFWNSYPFVRLSLVLISGITCYSHFPGIWDHFNTLIVLLLLATGLFVFGSKTKGHSTVRHLKGLSALITCFLIGGELVSMQYGSLPENHYTKLEIDVRGFTGKVSSAASERTNYHRYEFQLSRVATDDSIHHVTGKIHLYIKKDSGSTVYNFGDIVHVQGRFFTVSKPGNPYEFNFQEYLKLQQVYSHAFVASVQTKFAGHQPKSQLMKSAYRIRSAASKIIDRCIPNSSENSIAKALLLGIKDHIDNDLKTSYASAGAMHVLAVSGLHVGIVYMFLQFVLGKFKRTKTGRMIYGIVSVLVIWAYATVTGLSPSVLRAATMFTVMVLSEMSTQKGNIYNSLGIAAFILLLYDPYLIYSVGFQLSFAAVLGIVYLQPKIYRLISINNTLLDKAWAITCVSIAAQLSTFPLTAYYFHQFPTYFLVSNLVVIPAATVLLIGGIIMLMLDPISAVIGELIGSLLSEIIWILNQSVSLVESFPSSLIDWIYLDEKGMFLAYAIVIFLMWGLHLKSFHSLMISMILVSIFLISDLKKLQNQSKVEKIIIYQIDNRTAIDHIQGHQSTLYIDSQNYSPELMAYQIDPNRLASGLDPIRTTTVPFEHSASFKVGRPLTFGIIGTQRILIVDSTTFHLNFTQPIFTDVLVVENGAVKNLQWLDEHFQFEHLIIGNKNSRYYSAKMKNQATQFNVEIHSLKVDGAFHLDVRK